MAEIDTPAAFRLDFDPEWYLETYPDVALSGIPPETHYNMIGKLLGRLAGPSSAAIPAQPDASFEYLGEHVSTHNGPALVLAENGPSDLRFQGTVGIHAHMFHSDMLPECRGWMASIPVPFDLFVSVADISGAEAASLALRDLPMLNRLHVEIHPNQGRDIAPFVSGFGRRLAGYDVVGHFHSKKSSHTPGKKDWGIQLGHHLFHSAPHMTRLLNLFADQSDLGLVFPVYHPSIKGQIKWGANFARIKQEMSRLFGSRMNLTEADLLPFPAGSFFLARTDAIRCLLDGAFSYDDFETEAGQVDGTLAHAIERMLVLVAARTGHVFRQVRAEKPHSLGRAWLKGDGYHSPLLENIQRGNTPQLPIHAHPALAGLRIAFFTCSTGGYDQPLPFEGFVAEAEYLFFTDQTEGETRQGQWEMRPLALRHDHKIKEARRHKTQPHHFLEGVDIAIWIDANIAVTGDITPWIAQFLEEDAAFGVIPHPYRANVATELAELVKMKIDEPDLLNAQYARYQEAGFPDDAGLTETNLIVMDIRRPETRAALDIWWEQIDTYSRRDQMSFDYACWKAGARKVPLLNTGLSVRADSRFAYFDHGATRHDQLQARPALAALWRGESPIVPQSRRHEDSLTVDVVVCVHNSPDDVARCLHSIALNRDGRTRIIIVDDGSQPATQAVIARHMVRHPADLLIRHETARGYTKSANAGMRASNADYVILQNSDTIVPSGWVQALVRAGEADPRIGIIGPLSNAATYQSVPLTHAPSGDFEVNALPAGMTVDDVAVACARIPADPVYPSPVVNGFCFAIKRAVIDAIGYLDEEAFPQGYGEENDYCLRLPEAGFSCGFTLSTYVFHAKSKSFSHERRRVLSKAGWDSLVAKHGKEALSAAVHEMQHHPAFARARTWFKGLTCRHESGVRPIAFYLPQFHSFPANDRAWGAGFTEWRNVVKGRPRFTGHPQPRLPGELGYYDLRTPETLAAQGALAREYGVAGMAVYYYRFGHERLMSAPTDQILATPGIGPHFFYCWANEDWTRAWDGNTSDILRKQSYSEASLKLIGQDLIEACADSRYMRINDKPIFMIYQLNRLPDAAGAIGILRRQVEEALGIDIVIGTTWNPDFRPEWESLVDFIAQFPPHRTPRLSQRTLLSRQTIPGATEETEDFLEAYDHVVDQSLEAMDSYAKLAPGVAPDWDNSVRRARQANILVGSTPAKFEAWTRQAAHRAQAKAADGRLPAPLLFVNAWNEWAEGAVLEPSEKDGRAYLAAFRRGVM